MSRRTVAALLAIVANKARILHRNRFWNHNLHAQLIGQFTQELYKDQQTIP